MGIEAGIAIGVSALMSGATTAAGGAAIETIIVAAAVGAGVGALGYYMNRPDKPSSGRKNSDVQISSSIRNVPVPVVFGRARMSGNYIALGGFGGLKDKKKDTVGRRLQVLHGVLGMCEGPVRAMGNYFLDGRLLKNAAKREEFESKSRFYKMHPILGTADQGIHEYVQKKNSRFPGYPKIPWRNTAGLVLHTIVGDQPRLADANCDLFGPDYTVRREGSAPNIEVASDLATSGYDAYSQRFYMQKDGEQQLYTIPRETGAVETTTFPGAVTKAWYLGKHDIVVGETSATDNGAFFIGRMGLSADSTEWETVRPEPGYENPIKAWHLDELHGILHTLHDSGGNQYLMRWTLMTGRVERLDLDEDASEVKAICYSADHDAYAMVHPGGLRLVDPFNGDTITNMSYGNAATGICISGTRVGILDGAAMTFIDPYNVDIDPGYGSAATDLETEGALGGVIQMSQNSWTGHVTLVKSEGFINFFPSIVEEVDDVSAMGTRDEKEFQDFTTPSSPFYLGTKDDGGWVRDWSWRAGNQFKLVGLEGFSSLAGAMWALLVKNDDLDTARWGAGMSPEYFDYSSFEAVHGWCVGGVKFHVPELVNDEGKRFHAKSYYGERAKSDFVLSDQKQAGELLSNEFLASINGFRMLKGGKLHIGVPRRGAFSVWHFSEQQTKDGNVNLSMVGRANGVNRVRAQFRHIQDNHRIDFAESNDEYDQNVRGRVNEETISLEGIGRYGHAEWLAKALLDNIISSRRQIEFDLHFLGMVVTPGDIIEVSHKSVGSRKVLFRVTALSEGEDGVIRCSGLEHKRTLEALHTQGDSFNDDYGTGDDNQQDCVDLFSSIDGAARWVSEGVNFQPGTYKMVYTNGAYGANGFNAIVHGFEILTADIAHNNMIIPLDSAPGKIAEAPGYADETAAEEDNAGQSVTFQLAAAGPIGVRLKDEFRQLGPKQLEGALPLFEVCALQVGVCAMDLFNTGAESEDGFDMHWTCNGDYARVVGRQDGWKAAPAGMKWISKHADPSQTVAGAEMDYELTFQLGAKTSITGRCAVDNKILDILVNGSSTGLEFNGAGQWKEFTLPANLTTVGSNTVTFLTKNQDANTPHGLLVQFDDPCVGGVGGGNPAQSTGSGSVPPQDVEGDVAAITNNFSPTTGTRVEGPWNKDLANVWIKGYITNVILHQNRTFTFNNVRSTDAFRQNPAASFQGQGFYQEAGRVLANEIYVARNGWRTDQPLTNKNIFRHGIYSNVGCHWEMSNFIIHSNASIGGQFRGTSKLSNGIIIGNAIALAYLYGTHILENVTIYDPDYHWDSANWVGGVAIANYGTLRMKNVWIIGRSSHPAPDGSAGTNNGAIVGSESHPQYPSTPGSSITAENCRIMYWPGDPFTGDQPHDGSGFAIDGGTGPIDLDVSAILNQIEQNVVTIESAVEYLHGALRGAVLPPL